MILENLTQSQQNLLRVLSGTKMILRRKLLNSSSTLPEGRNAEHA